MAKPHDHRRSRASEATPVQVFLGVTDRSRLDRLTEQLETSKSEVLRRSLVALEQHLLDPAAHPALRIIGLVDEDEGVERDVGDLAVHHDRYLAATHSRPRPTRNERRRGKS
jgi:hypothetical protein